MMLLLELGHQRKLYLKFERDSPKDWGNFNIRRRGNAQWHREMV